MAREIKPDEYRVALTPAGARELAQRGHEVIVESGAGDGSSFPDSAYEAVGARVDSVDAVWGEAELLLKVKEPIASEYPRLREGLVLFTYLHIAADEPLTRALLESGITAVAYETVETDQHALPLLAPMSEVAGRLAIEAAGAALRKSADGMGKLIGGVPGVAPSRIAVIGGGVVGTHAARMAAGLGADIAILDRSLPRLAGLDALGDEHPHPLAAEPGRRVEGGELAPRAPGQARLLRELPRASGRQRDAVLVGLDLPGDADLHAERREP